MLYISIIMYPWGKLIRKGVMGMSHPYYESFLGERQSIYLYNLICGEGHVRSRGSGCWIVTMKFTILPYSRSMNDLNSGFIVHTRNPQKSSRTFP